MRFSEFIKLDEIDWKNTFKDVKPTCVDAKVIVDYLNQVRKSADMPYGKRPDFPITMPFFHAKSPFFKDDKTGIDVEYFIKQITEKPNTIVNTNDKILKSGKPNEFVYKTGIPAFRGIAYDIENEKFIVINTCPGAGECVTICYALKGHYIQYPASYDGMTRRLNLLLNNPNAYEEQLYTELKEKCEEHKAIKGYINVVVMRWNDSGDFFSRKYVQIAHNVMRRLQDEGYNIKDYAYTKVADVATQSEIGNVVFSKGGKSSEGKKVDTQTDMAKSFIVPRNVFAGLDYMKIEDIKNLKKRISNYFKINEKDVITYQEMKIKSEGKKRRWFVIVTPNDGDDAAWRKDVLGIMLLQH